MVHAAGSYIICITLSYTMTYFISSYVGLLNSLVYVVSGIRQTVLLINTPRAYKRPNSSLRLENNLRHQTSRTSIIMVHIYMICVVI